MGGPGALSVAVQEGMLPRHTDGYNVEHSEQAAAVPFEFREHVEPARFSWVDVLARGTGPAPLGPVAGIAVPVEDADVSAFLEKSLTKQGMTIMTGAGVEDLKVTAKGVTAKIKDSKGKVSETEFSHCITAIGIVPNTENVGLEKLAEMDRGFIQIDDYGRTKSKGLWAIGDCTPGPWLAHKARHAGVTTAEAIA